MPRKFQSTHPLRGATRLPEVLVRSMRISIHAPLAGCDFNVFVKLTNIRAFQPSRKKRIPFQSTHPLRGATQRRKAYKRRSPYFNPRTPCGVRHRVRCAKGFDTLISIHAPLAGCDSKNAQKLLRIFAATDKTQDISDRTLPVKVFRPMRSMMETVRFRCEPPHKTMYAHNSHYTISGSSGK